METPKPSEVILKETAKSSWEKYLAEHEAPHATVLEITNYCNIGKCAHCYIDAVEYQPNDGKGTFMDLTTVNAWAEALASNTKGKPEQIWITGGEPTLNPQLGKILETLKNRGFYNALVTNGENFAREGGLDSILNSGNLDEIAVTVRGAGALHDLLILPADDPIWEEVSNELPLEEQIRLVKKKKASKHYEITLNGIANICRHQDINLALNIDIQAAADLEEIVEDIKKRGGRVDIVYLQVQQETGRTKEREISIPNGWRRPSVEMVKSYLEQANNLINNGLVEEVHIIDPLPQEIVSKLDLEKEPIYEPAATPAISPRGELRKDVVG